MPTRASLTRLACEGIRFPVPCVLYRSRPYMASTKYIYVAVRNETYMDREHGVNCSTMTPLRRHLLRPTRTEEGVPIRYLTRRGGTRARSQRGLFPKLRVVGAHHPKRARPYLPSRDRNAKRTAPRICGSPPAERPCVSSPALRASTGSSCHDLIGAPSPGLGVVLRSCRPVVVSR